MIDPVDVLLIHCEHQMWKDVSAQCTADSARAMHMEWVARIARLVSDRASGSMMWVVRGDDEIPVSVDAWLGYAWVRLGIPVQLAVGAWLQAKHSGEYQCNDWTLKSKPVLPAS